ncbi:MAG: ornithine carbamoyltransferase [Leptospirillum sp.]|nr:ornithine carbamoyltransferase [Nitrospiraceae bacterium]
MKKGTRSFLRLSDLSEESASYLLDFSVRIKKTPELFENMLRRQTVGLIFEKASTRTRLSFEAGVHQMGGDTLFLGSDSQLSRGESVEDTARVVGGYLDLVVMRTFGHDRIERFAQYCPVPVINGLTDQHHPCQALSDLAYARELFSELRGLPITYIGDGNNMAHSLMEAAALFGSKMTVSTPREYRPDEEILKASDTRARKNGGFVRWMEDPLLASEKAMVLYTDVWTSMGQEAEKSIRELEFAGYQINEAVLHVADPNAVIFHCLPAYRGLEITASAIDGPQSRVFLQARYRLYLQKAVMLFCLGKDC